jgi:hypothetical protein
VSTEYTDTEMQAVFSVFTDHVEGLEQEDMVDGM